MPKLDEFDSPGGERNHFEQKPAMTPALDLGGAVSPLPVSHRQIDDLQVQLCSTENQVKIAEGVKVSEIGSVLFNSSVLFPFQDLGSTESVFDRLSKEPEKVS